MTGREKVMKDFPKTKTMNLQQIIDFIKGRGIKSCKYCSNKYSENKRELPCFCDDRKTCNGGIRKFLKSEVKE